MAVTVDSSPSLLDALSSFTSATNSAVDGLPSLTSFTSPDVETSGISLLTTKNELFLAYLQTLALRNLHVLRVLKEGGDFDAAAAFNDEVTKKLAELRVYIERGVRPLEGKIAYQVDKVMRVAEDEERRAKEQTTGRTTRKPTEADSSDDEDDESESSDDDEPAIASSAHRANAANFAAPQSTNTSASRSASKSKSDGVYRPPRISATSMPSTTPDARERGTSDRRRAAARSATLDEYISTELSTAPRAEPSIGSTIAQGGRRNKDARALAKEQERRDYEETNLVRLPAESKKELGKALARERRNGGGFGGEEWRDLGESVDRIGELTRRKGGRESVLERSRKRKGGDGSGMDGMGEAFERRKRRVLGRR